jgi:multidrug efflux pump subunit AcrB
VTITPLLCVWFLKIPEAQGEDPYDKPMFRRYRRFLHEAVRRRVITVTATVGLLVAALFGFRFVEQTFFPDSTTPYFYVNYWRPAGTHIERTAEDVGKISAYLRTLDGVKNVSTYTGEGTLRFLLSYNYETPDSAYGMLLVEVDDYRKIAGLIQQSDAWMKANYPDSEPYSTTIPNGPPVDFKVEARFSGPDREVLRQLAGQAEAVMRAESTAKNIRLDWRQPVQVLRPEYAESQARRAGVTRADLALALQYNFSGLDSGLYREGNDLIPITGRPPADERVTVDNIENVQVWSSLKHTFVPIGQVVTALKQEWEWPLAKRRDRRPSVTVRCQPLIGLAEPLRLKLKDRIEAIELPSGYHFEWAGEYKKSVEAKGPLAATFPLCFAGMFVILVGLFNSVRRPLIIFMTVPLALIGVVGGLLLTGIPFGFMAILGFLGLSGMIIKNAIVLIDEVEVQLAQGVPAYKAVLDSAVSRLRPVMMAAGTTILGMAPLLTDPLYSGMAVTIMGGLLIATFLTLVLVPVVYTMVYRVRADATCL